MNPSNLQRPNLQRKRQSHAITVARLSGARITVAWLSVLLVALALSSDSATGAEPPTIGEHDDNVYTLAFSPDGRRLASASGDHTAVLRDVVDGGNRVTLPHESPVYAVQYSPDGRLIATADGAGHVRLWSPTGTQIAVQQKHTDAVYAVAFSPDGLRLATAGGGGNGGDTRCLIWDLPSLTLRQELSGHTRAVYGLVFRPNGKSLISASSDRSLRVWDLSNASSEIFEDHTSDAYRCGLSPDGRLVISAGQDKHVRQRTLHESKTSSASDSATVSVSVSLEPVSRDPVYGALFTPDGRLIVAAGDDCRLHIWNNTTGYPHQSATRISRQALYALAVSPDSKSVAVAGADHRIYLIELPSPVDAK